MISQYGIHMLQPLRNMAFQFGIACVFTPAFAVHDTNNPAIAHDGLINKGRQFPTGFIQPIAVQITKLRFFISLIVDQNLDEKRGNRGILALPNLETKFVAANTLIGLEKPKKQIHLFKNKGRLLFHRLPSILRRYCYC